MQNLQFSTRLAAGCAVMIVAAFTNRSSAADDEYFERYVRPVLVSRCQSCHNAEKKSGGLSLESKIDWMRGGDSGPAIIPNDPEGSRFIDAIQHRSLEMPPPDAGGKLSPAEIEVLIRWVRMGAPDPRVASPTIGGMDVEQAKSWWSFQPLAVDRDSSSHSIDQFLDREIQTRGLSKSDPADKRTLLRRATYDLTGLPPTEQEVKAFLEDSSPDAFRRVIDRLLNSPQYGVHWGRHWLDVVRYADTAGENSDRPLPHAWRYRNWVIESFNRDLPFDEFTRMQLSGDRMVRDSDSPHSVHEGIVATGYLAIARRFGHNIDDDMHLTFEDVIDNVGKSFLGLSISCARCHDHKYDPISAEDYYALYGIFSSTKFAFPGCEPVPLPRDLVPLIDESESQRLMSEYQQRLAGWEAAASDGDTERLRLKELAEGCSRVLGSAMIEEGQSVSLGDHEVGRLESIKMKKGEVLQVAVSRNGNHGADTTRIEWEMTRASDQQHWHTDSLVPRLMDGPLLQDNGAVWCLMDVTNGPRFLIDRREVVDGTQGLSAWAMPSGLPSVTVNANDHPVNVWTQLPPRTLFVHPGPAEDVAVAWVCPADGVYEVRLTVADAHGAPGLDGVSFRLEHFASDEMGQGLVRLGKLSTAPKPPKPEPPDIPVAYAVVDGQPNNEPFHIRGDPEQSGDEIPRRWLSAFGGTPLRNPSESGRRELAEWITQNPLFARVLANRIWQWHFGAGLVTTPNDFGFRGAAPTHPELLDWLAQQLIDGGYQLKPMHRMIMMSDAYQRSSLVNQEIQSRDPSNQWLARFSRRRLSAEEIRDSLLAVSWQLDLSFGQAHPFPPESTWKYTQHDPFHAAYETKRRSAFMMVQRQRRHPFLALFDGADPNMSTPRRDQTTVPTQSLYFLNDSFVHEQAGETVAGLIEVSGVDLRLHALYQRMFQRPATRPEMSSAEEFFSVHPGDETSKWSAYARVLMASNEMVYLD